MSRSALIVAGALFALGALVWLRTGGDEGAGTRPAIEAVRDTAPPPPAPLPATPPPAAPAGKPAAAPGSPPRISTRDEFVRALDARGLDGERLLTAYREWRLARGFLGADPLAGITAEGAPAQIYATMDRATQKSLAESGDLGALQAYAAGSLPADPVTAIEYFSRAAALGSAAAMGEIASILAGIGDQDPGGPGNDPTFPERLLALRGGEPHRDLRPDAMAWTLAAIRQHGPIVATPAGLALTRDLERNPDKGAVAIVCGRSLAILADLSAANAGGNPATLPPAFLAEQDLYARLPCRDTPAPVTPPRALGNCRPSPAVGGNNQPVDLWICAGD